jgi:hypothetical protein
MARVQRLTNVKAFIVWVNETCTDMLNRSGRYEKGLILAEIDKANLAQIRLIGEAILRKHAVRKTRKDVYIGE